MIDEIISKRLTGNLIIMCVNNKSAQLSFNKGEVVGLRCGAFLGNKAINSLIDSEFVSLKFLESQHLIKTDIPPSIQQILARLKSIDTQDAVIDKRVTQNEGSTQGLSSADIDRFSEEIKSVLTDYLGPVAAFIFNDTKQDILTGEELTSDQLKQFVIYLADNIKDEDDSKKFLNVANSLINKYTKK